MEHQPVSGAAGAGLPGTGCSRGKEATFAGKRRLRQAAGPGHIACGSSPAHGWCGAWRGLCAAPSAWPFPSLVLNAPPQRVGQPGQSLSQGIAAHLGGSVKGLSAGILLPMTRGQACLAGSGGGHGSSQALAPRPTVPRESLRALGITDVAPAWHRTCSAFYAWTPVAPTSISCSTTLVFSPLLGMAELFGIGLWAAGQGAWHSPTAPTVGLLDSAMQAPGKESPFTNSEQQQPSRLSVTLPSTGRPGLAWGPQPWAEQSLPRGHGEFALFTRRSFVPCFPLQAASPSQGPGGLRGKKPTGPFGSQARMTRDALSLWPASRTHQSVEGPGQSVPGTAPGLGSNLLLCPVQTPRHTHVTWLPFSQCPLPFTSLTP
ncbi:protein phosphatase 1A [Platysternon megacephalum]|uniref:Protein phosphatase 1A n=1 Tax=Platysternon megacephalum TaxID=55544 RepID=A0A4D9E5Z3_9SAUR|nr:protein phosphatase 1A [Platysternon megacephalum]